MRQARDAKQALLARQPK
ncbi:hypothetical protein A2U01_0089179, partial [Trifolium medium]|nr:hypothetical protein [Trifolium medium]